MVNDIISKQYKLVRPIRVEFQVKHKGKVITMELEVEDLVTIECKSGSAYSLCGDTIRTKECSNGPKN